MTLEEAKNLLYDRAVDGGSECPCCGQFAKVYQRTIHATMARELIDFYHFAGTQWGRLADSGVQRGGDMVKVRYWGLIEEQIAVRKDGSSRTGWWRVTDKGEEWILGNCTIPKYAHIYNGECLTVDGKSIGVCDALGQKFNYQLLMNETTKED